MVQKRHVTMLGNPRTGEYKVEEYIESGEKFSMLQLEIQTQLTVISDNITAKAPLGGQEMTVEGLEHINTFLKPLSSGFSQETN